MSAQVALAVALRVLGQLRHDPRTLALALVVPCMLELILQQLFGRDSPIFQQVGTPLLGLFPFVTMFLVTSITMLRERTSGTLERLMTMPLQGRPARRLRHRLRAARDRAGDARLRPGLRVPRARGRRPEVARRRARRGECGARSTLGLFVSAFAQTEFQAVQFMPAVVFPQILLCGLFVAREEMATRLRVVSALFPLTYAYDALARTADDRLDARFAFDVAVVCACIVLAISLGAATSVVEPTE